MTIFIIYEKYQNRLIYTTTDGNEANEMAFKLNSHCPKDLYEVKVFTNKVNEDLYKKENQAISSNIYWRIKFNKDGDVIDIRVSKEYSFLDKMMEDAWKNVYVYIKAKTRLNAIKTAREKFYEFRDQQRDEHRKS